MKEHVRGEPPARGISRRSFIRGAAIGGAAAALWPGALVAGTPLGHADRLRALAWQGLAARLGDRVPAAYRTRLAYELEVVTRLAFTDDLLLLHDVVSWVRERGIPIFPGHGSVSLACWALGLGELDPVAHGLCFERFINWRRPPQTFPFYSFPLCARRQPEVLEHLSRRFGAGRVAYAAWPRDVRLELLQSAWCARPDRDPETAEASFEVFFETLREHPDAMLAAFTSGVSRLPPALARDPRTPDVLRLAHELARDPAASCYADLVPGGAILVGETPLEGIRSQDVNGLERPVAPLDTREAENAGIRLLRCPPFRALTALGAARVQPWPPDGRVFAMIAAGDVEDVIGLESHLRPYLREARPSSLEEMAAAMALWRPCTVEGGMADDFVTGTRGWGRPGAGWPPAVQRILAPTRGVLVFMEQLMAAVRAVAGLDLAEADLLRRALCRQRPRESSTWEERFVAAAVAHGTSRRVAEQTFVGLEHLAPYLFGGAYALSAATLSLRLACLKAHAPAELARVSREAYGA